MALLNQVDLGLNITATDKASQVLKDLLVVVGDLKTTLTGLADINPFTGLRDSALSATQTVQTLKDLVLSLGDMQVNPFAVMVQQANTAAEDCAYAFTKSFADLQLPQPFTPLLTDAREIASQLTDTFDQAIQAVTIPDILAPLQATATEIVDSLGTVKEYLVQIESEAAADPLAAWVTSAQDLRTTLQETQASMMGMGSATSEASGGSSGGLLNTLNQGINHVGMGLMMGGMNAMMGYYGLQMLAGGAGNMANIQRMAQINNQTPNEAAQSYAMLASVGMTGSAGVSFLSQLSGNLQKTFTPAVGSGALSQSAILLQSLGINQSDIGTSPWQLLNTLGGRYRGLLSQGRGSQAAELLSLTGTSSAANLLANWSGMSQQMSGINLGMNSAQLKASVGQSMSLQGNLQRLSLSFDELATKMVPAVNSVTQALTGLADGLSGKTSIVTAIQRVTSALGPLGTAVAAAVVAIKGLAAVKGFMNLGKGAAAAGTSAMASSTFMGLLAMLSTDTANLPGLANQMIGAPSGWKGKWNPSGLNSSGPLLPVPSWWPALKLGLTQATIGVEKWAAGTWHAMASGLSTTWHHLTQWATEVWAWISRGLASFPKNITSWAQGMDVWFIRGANSFPAKLAQWASTLWASFLQGVGNFASGLRQWASTLWSSFMQSLGLSAGGAHPTAVSGSHAAGATTTAVTKAVAAATAGATGTISLASTAKTASAPIWVNHHQYSSWGVYHASQAKTAPNVTHNTTINIQSSQNPSDIAKAVQQRMTQLLSYQTQFP